MPTVGHDPPRHGQPMTASRWQKSIRCRPALAVETGIEQQPCLPVAGLARLQQAMCGQGLAQGRQSAGPGPAAAARVLAAAGLALPATGRWLAPDRSRAEERARACACASLGTQAVSAPVPATLAAVTRKPRLVIGTSVAMAVPCLSGRRMPGAPSRRASRAL
jgi:hypothetical protein